MKGLIEPTNLSLDFIAGLIAGEGSFMWINQNNNTIPVFQLKMIVGKDLYLRQLRRD